MKTKTTLIALALIALAACKTVSYPNEVSKIAPGSGETMETGTLWLNATGYGTDAGNARKDAEKAAFRKILFQGIPGSQWNMPMVPDESVSKRDHASFYTSFLDGGGYSEMILSSSPGPLNKVEGNNKLETRLKVDMNALRRHLEKNDIIRKFGL
mgnify:CR=1 FL=1